jgi:hypothetical protein
MGHGITRLPLILKVGFLSQTVRMSKLGCGSSVNAVSAPGLPTRRRQRFARAARRFNGGTVNFRLTLADRQLMVDA